MDAKVVYQKLSTPVSTSQEVSALEGWEPNYIRLNTSTRNLVSNDPKKSNLRRKLACILIPTVALVIAVVVIAVVWYSVVLKTRPTYFCTVMLPYDEPEEISDDLGNDIHILTRKRWGDRDIRNGYQNRTLVHPIKLVIIGDTASPMCMTRQQCAQQLQSIQSAHASNNSYVDIGDNFLVGGDGNIYQALGWDIQNNLRNNSIQIQFIGNYSFDEVLARERMAAQALLKRGVELGKLDENYLLVGADQSLGAFLKADIQSWPHYYNGTLT